MMTINLLKPKARIPHWLDDYAIEEWTDRLEGLYQRMNNTPVGFSTEGSWCRVPDCPCGGEPT